MKTAVGGMEFTLSCCSWQVLGTIPVLFIAKTKVRGSASCSSINIFIILSFTRQVVSLAQQKTWNRLWSEKGSIMFHLVCWICTKTQLVCKRARTCFFPQIVFTIYPVLTTQTRTSVLTQSSGHHWKGWTQDQDGHTAANDLHIRAQAYKVKFWGGRSLYFQSWHTHTCTLC